MKPMKIFFALLCGMLAFGFVYLLGVFASATFDINAWSQDGRALVAYIGGIAAIFASFYVLVHSIG